MKKTSIILLLTLVVFFVFSTRYFFRNNPAEKQNNQPAIQDDISQGQNAANNINQTANGFQAPLDRASERVTKKPFGIHIAPATSPVQPERFQGYHTGTDFEIFPEEINEDVPVQAVCSGKLLIKKYASGYGGVAVESCEAENNPITVIYGHLKLSSILLKEGDAINTGDAIGILGKGNSAETDGERKHLHLGFHRGIVVNIKGYTSAKTELSGWLDPCVYVCFN